MAKKIGAGTIAAIAIATIIGLGSVSALLRGREKEEEASGVCEHVYEPYEHTNELGTYSGKSNICSKCGEHLAEFLASDTMCGYNLAGYQIQLAETEAEFTAWYSEIGLPTVCDFVFKNSNQTLLFDSDRILRSGNIIVASFGSAKVEVFNNYSTIPAGEDWIVINLSGTPMGTAAEHFKFVYVGETPSAAAVSYKAAPATAAETETVEQNETESADGYEVVNDLPVPGEEWSNFY